MQKNKPQKMIAGEIIRLHELPNLIGLSRATIYRMISKGNFVPVIHLTSQSRGVRRSDVELWIEMRIKGPHLENGSN